MDYVSCFSGIGGLEGRISPIAVCDIDPLCREILFTKFPKAKIFPDIRLVDKLRADVIVGGWPCQDISVAGNQIGLSGENSGLFYDFVAAAKRINAQTIIAENVPNLLRLDNGDVFREVLSEFKRAGYIYCSWRILNARSFGLPHHRSRVFIIASNNINHCTSLYRNIPKQKSRPGSVNKSSCAGFYWTAGTQSICYSQGYVPTIKIGSSLSIPSPPAVHYADIVRPLTSNEALRLQGFDEKYFLGFNNSTKYRMAGNAVAIPVGRFVVDGVLDGLSIQMPNFESSQYGLFSDIEFKDKIPDCGFYDGEVNEIRLSEPKSIADNLIDFLDIDCELRLSSRAAQGLLRRLNKSGLDCPDHLRILLEDLSQ